VTGVGERQRTADTRSFESFYPWAHEEVYRVLVLTLRDAELAADAAQEALARAYRRWDEVSSYANPAGWVYRVALNYARSRFRRQLREWLTDQPSSPRALEAPAPADPAVERALAGLPVEQRAVVVLRLYLDWPVEEVAVALGIRPGTVKSRLARALERLRERLEDER
jgi:RNA polymerase sigma-70 factor, ECF subfamily